MTHGFQYVALRCVPRVDREEFLNVAVVLYCQETDYLACATKVDEARLAAFVPALDVTALRAALAATVAVCTGDPTSGAAGKAALTTRFGFIAAPRSTVVQPGPVHGGTTADPQEELRRLARHYLE